MSELGGWLAWGGLAVFGVSAVARQLIRERLFAAILAQRSHVLDESWYVNRQKTALHDRYVWGKDSRAMLRAPHLQKLIIGARIATGGVYLGIACVAVLALQASGVIA